MVESGVQDQSRLDSKFFLHNIKKEGRKEGRKKGRKEPYRII